MIHTQFGRGIQRFCSDNARDFVNSDLASYFAEHGILHETSCVATPEHNGMAERRISYVTSMAQTLLPNYHVPWTYWGEANLTSTHLVNRLPSQQLAFTSPIDRMHAAFLDIPLRTGLLPRIFGYTAYVHDPSASLTKLDARALCCVFVGYSSLQKGYKCYHPPSRRFISANVTFAEYESFFGARSSSSCLPLDEAPLALLPVEPTVLSTGIIREKTSNSSVSRDIVHHGIHRDMISKKLFIKRRNYMYRNQIVIIGEKNPNSSYSREIVHRGIHRDKISKNPFIARENMCTATKL